MAEQGHAPMQIALIESTQIEALAPKLQTHGTLVVMPVLDVDMGRRAATLAAARAQAPGLMLVVQDSARMGLVRVHNQVFRHSRSASYAYLAQDAFAGREWLRLGLDALTQQNAGLVAFNDGKWQGQLASFGLVQRDWAASVYDGALFFEGYHSHYADTELTLVAREQHRYAYDANAVVVEVDWGKDSASTHGDDKRLFQTRAKQGFGGRVTREELKGLFG